MECPERRQETTLDNQACRLRKNLLVKGMLTGKITGLFRTIWSDPQKFEICDKNGTCSTRGVDALCSQQR